METLHNPTLGLCHPLLSLSFRHLTAVQFSPGQLVRRREGECRIKNKHLSSQDDSSVVTHAYNIHGLGVAEAGGSLV